MKKLEQIQKDGLFTFFFLFNDQAEMIARKQHENNATSGNENTKSITCSVW